MSFTGILQDKHGTNSSGRKMLHGLNLTNIHLKSVACIYSRSIWINTLENCILQKLKLQVWTSKDKKCKISDPNFFTPFLKISRSCWANLDPNSQTDLGLDFDWTTPPDGPYQNKGVWVDMEGHTFEIFIVKHRNVCLQLGQVKEHEQFLGICLWTTKTEIKNNRPANH